MLHAADMRAASIPILLLLIACDSLFGVCGNDHERFYPSPDGRRTLVVFWRSCGATTSDTLQASVVSGTPASAPSGAGELFIADDDHQTGVPLEVEVKWIDPNHVVIVHDRRLRFFQQAARMRGVEVSYQAGVLKPSN